MKITYIGHSGFWVELERAALLFDYYQGEIPKLPEGKKLYVFSSHRHGDHFNPEIFVLAKQYEDVQYVFSRDIWRSRVPEELQAQVVQMKANTEWTAGSEADGPPELPKMDTAAHRPPEPQQTDIGLTVRTLRSTDAGVAFLVQTEGRTLYHAGDLNDWRWEGEPEDWNRRMGENFKKFLEPIRGWKIDAAFVPLDPRQEENYALGLDYFLGLVDVEKVYPMHCWEDYSVIHRWFLEHPDSPYREKIITISGRGESFFQE